VQLNRRQNPRIQPPSSTKPVAIGTIGTRCENAAAELEICRINFQNAKSTEQVLRRVKEIVIVNL